MLKLLQRLTGSENSAPDPVAAKLEAQHHHGLINFGNTCYCNSVIQVWSINTHLQERNALVIKFWYLYNNVCFMTRVVQARK